MGSCPFLYPQAVNHILPRTSHSMGILSIFKSKKESLDRGLTRTKEGFFQKIARAVGGRKKLDAEFLDDLEEALITSDVGVETAAKIIARLEKRVEREKSLEADHISTILKDEVTEMLAENQSSDVSQFDIPDNVKPFVIMVVGVNGVGKTTTIGKLAWQFNEVGKTVMLGAADTFRAAAIDQLGIWGERVGAEVVRKEMGSDPGSVAFETVDTAKRNGADIVLIDTAGRLHNKVGLMDELSKVKRVIGKVVPEAPHEVLLVLDASTGQNALQQAKEFTKATDVTAIALTKLDGTAKGGVVLGIADQFQIPIKFIGVGEQMEDLQLFDRAEFVERLFAR